MFLIVGVLASGMAWRGRTVRNNAGTLTVGVSGSTQGYLEPCGCETGEAGGLARRQTLIQQHKPDLLIDAGSVFGGTGTYERLKGTYLLRGMKQMGYTAVNLGETELALPVSAFAEATRGSGLTFVSCNVTAADKAAVPIAPFRIETRGNLHVGITGIVDVAELRQGKDWTFTPPLEALTATLPTLRAQCDILLVLASAPSETLTAIAERFPEIDAVLGSTSDGATGISKVNRTTVVMTGTEGKTYTRLTFGKQAQTARFEVVAAESVKVANTIIPDPKIAALIAEFHAQLRTRHLKPSKTEGMERLEKP